MKAMCIFFILLLMTFTCLCSAALAAEDDDDQTLIESDPDFITQYVLQLSGTVFKETFTGARAILSLQMSSDFDTNPYLMIIEGFPKLNTRNSFYWHSENSEMEAISNQIVCVIKNSIANPPDMHFFYISPTLLENKGPFETQHEEERRQMAEQRALPTRIFATAGELRLRIYSNHISGSVWLKGYDFTQNAYVLYNANVHGVRSLNLGPKREKKK